MPAYVNSPFQKPILATKGVPVYLWGSFDFKVGNSKLFVTNVALTSNVASVTATLLEGPAPQTGGLISIINTTTSTGLFSVNRATITGVTATQATGVCVITFALTSTNVSSTADSGTVICEPPETAETLAAGASQACVIQSPDSDSQFTVPISVTFPTAPTAATVTLQKALIGRDTNEWTNTSAVVTYASSAYSAGPVVEATLERGYMYRFINSSITGSGTIIARIGA